MHEDSCACPIGEHRADARRASARPHACVGAGETLLARDTVAQRDSAFALHLATAYRAAGNPYRAIETLAHGVVTFAGDAQLCALYAQYVRAEADTVIPRGIALFPKRAELLALRSQRLRAKDGIAESWIRTWGGRSGRFVSDSAGRAVSSGLWALGFGL